MKLIAWRESDDGDLAETEQQKKKLNTIKKIITKPSTPPCCPVCLLFLLKDIQGLKRHVTASLSFQVPCSTWHHKATASRKQESATSFLQYSDPFFKKKKHKKNLHLSLSLLCQRQSLRLLFLKQLFFFRIIVPFGSTSFHVSLCISMLNMRSLLYKVHR